MNLTIVYKIKWKPIQIIRHTSKENFQCTLFGIVLKTHGITCKLNRWNSGCNEIYKKDQ